MTASVKALKTPTLVLGSVAMVCASCNLFINSTFAGNSTITGTATARAQKSLWTVTIAAIIYYGFENVYFGPFIAALLLIGINFAYNYVTARILLLLTKHSFPTEEDQKKVRGHVARLVCFILVNLAVWVTTTATFAEYYDTWNNTDVGKSLLCRFLAGFTFLPAIAVAVPAGLISNKNTSEPRVEAYDNPAMRGSQSYYLNHYSPPPVRDHPARPAHW